MKIISNDWKAVTLRSDDNVEKAINILDRESPRIVLVSDKDGVLIGTVTDGDVRRALISHKNTDTNLYDIMCTDPVYVSMGDDETKIVDMMREKSIFQVPVLNCDKQIIDLKTLGEIFEENKKENPVLLMAGGFGKRLRPLTNDIPKPLLTVADKPILLLIIENFKKYGFYKFFISVHYKSDLIIDFFGDGKELGVEIAYIYEDTPLGTAGSLGGLPVETNLPIIVSNADLLTRLDYVSLLDFHKLNNSSLTVCTRKHNVDIPFGVVSCKKNRVTKIEEKPTQSFFINAGIYVVNPFLLQTIKDNTYIDMPNFINNLLNKNVSIGAFPIHEYWMDIGQMHQYEKAQNDFFEIKL
jgi:dTDP-glucose pyrophosphorylase/predicted transcriptional regulator